MKNIKFIKYIFFIYLSFFVFSFHCFASEQIVLNNIAKSDYLNIYSLQYDNRDISQRYYNFFKDINFDLYTFVFNQLSLDDIKYYIGYKFLNNYYYFTLKANVSSNSMYEYDLTNGIIVYINSCEYFDRIKLSSYGIGNNINISFDSSYPYNTCNSSIYNLIINDDNSVDFKHKSNIGYSLNYTTLDFSDFLGLFFQSNFYIDFEETSAERPVYISGINLNGNSDIYFSDTHKYLGYEYFDNNLMFGPGIPLYPARSYFINSFEFGVPYTDDYTIDYISSNSRCFFTPTKYLADNYDILHSENKDLIYFKDSNGNNLSLEQRLHFYSFYDINYYKELDSDTIDIVNKDSVYPEDYINYDYLDIDNINLFSFSPKIFTSNSIIEVRLSNNNFNDSTTIYYPKDLYNFSCTLGNNDFNIVDSNGTNHTITPSTFETAESDTNFLKYIYNVINSSITSIKNIFANLFSKTSNFLSYIYDSITDVFSLELGFDFIGSMFGSFFSNLPAVVQLTLNFVFVIGILIIILRFIIG